MTGPGLALLFTPGITLGRWRRAGFLAREVAYYGALSERVGPVLFVHEGVEAGASDLGTIGVVANPAHLPSLAFWPRAAARVARDRGRPRIVKTNQLAGAIGLLAAKAAGAHAVARGGWVQAEPWWYPTPRHPRRAVAIVREAVLTRAADIVFVSSADGARGVERRQRLPAGRVRVLPNFVETERFGVERPRVRGLVTVVGRLSHQKDPLAAVDAVAAVPGARLRVVGDGPLRVAAEERARARGVRAEFLGVVPHERLPELLAETDVYLSASRYEGHPKSLIEAMAAGAACVARRAPGVTPVLEHDRSGYLADPGRLAEALAAVLADRELRDRIAEGARAEAARYSLERVLAVECEAYRAAGWLAP